MPTGACGISCNVCYAYQTGKCPTGGCSKGIDADGKLKRQRETLGFVCPILECAVRRGVAYCPRDCESFPCTVYFEAGFPYSEKFLKVMKSFKGES